jgi:cytoskeleton protein RodZ
MTLDDVATATKVGSRMLKAIEEEHFDQLPGGIFNKGFVRAYARHLGLDEDQAVADYLATVSASQPIAEPEVVLTALAVKAERARSSQRLLGHAGLPWEKLAAGLLVVGFGFALWGWRDHKRHSRIDTQAKQSDAQATQSDAQEKQVEPASSLPAASPVSPPVVANNPAGATGSPEAGGNASSTPLQSAPVPSTPVQSAPGQSAPAQSPLQPASPGLGGTFTLLIRANGDSWIQVTVDGKDLINQLLPAGAQKSIDAEHEITVRAGNIGGLDFTLNGKKLSAQGAPDEVKTVKFDATGVRAPAAVSPPSQKPA